MSAGDVELHRLAADSRRLATDLGRLLDVHGDDLTDRQRGDVAVARRHAWRTVRRLKVATG